MTIKETLDTIYLCWLSKPKADRELYRCLRRHRIRSIVELGVETPDRCRRMIRLARRFSDGQGVSYSGVDLFEARPSQQPRLTLKQAHRQLSGSGAAVRLIPGDAFSGLARCANQLQGTQLLLISPDQDPIQLAQAWRYIPRMLSSDAIVLQATRDGSRLHFHHLTADEVHLRARSAERQRRAA